jgi:hypothetical protein
MHGIAGGARIQAWHCFVDDSSKKFPEQAITPPRLFVDIVVVICIHRGNQMMSRDSNHRSATSFPPDNIPFQLTLSRKVNLHLSARLDIGLRWFTATPGAHVVALLLP